MDVDQRIQAALSKADAALDRGAPRQAVVLADALSKLVVDGKKSMIVKSRPFVPKDRLFLVGDDQVRGLVTLSTPEPMSIKEFNERFDDHLISDELRKQFWPRTRKLYGYTVEFVEAVATPCKLLNPATRSGFVLDPQIEVTSTLSADPTELTADAPVEAESEKGMEVGEPRQEAGVHGHILDRSSSTTETDGAHTHLFVFPDGSIAETAINGVHAHTYKAADLRSANDGAHTHVINLPDDSRLETKEDGAHPHDLLVFTTGVDGIHTHELELSEGETIKSLTPAEFLGLLEELAAEAAEPEDVPNNLDKMLTKAVENASAAQRKNLPDSAFAWVGKGTDERNRRILPHHVNTVKSASENTSVDVGRLRNAFARINQVRDVPQAAISKARTHLNTHANVVLPGRTEKLAEELSIEEVIEILDGILRKTLIDKNLVPEAAFAEHSVVLKRTGEERFVLGVVLEPDVVDGQDDTYTAEEVRKTAHFWMEKFGQLKLMHKGEALEDRVKILESYISPSTFVLDGETIKKGTWLLAVRVIDEPLWVAVKEGRLTGFSIGGTALFEFLDDSDAFALNLSAA